MSDERPGDGAEETPVVYSVRINPRAEREVFLALAEIESASGPDIAAEWYQGIRAVIGSLATYPRRYAAQQAESRYIGFEVRRVLYHRPGSTSPGYHLLYRVEDADDGPVVRIVHVRHASRRPMTRAEGRALRDDP